MQEEAYSYVKKVIEGIPEGSVLGPLLSPVYEWHINAVWYCIDGKFGDATTKLFVAETVEQSANKNCKKR